MDYIRKALEIIEGVGGKSNIKNLTHCATRLRFELVDNEKADKDKLNSISEVQGVVERTKQLQIVIGQGIVEEVYKEIQNVLPDGREEAVRSQKQKITIKGMLDVFLETVSSIFAPIIPAITGAGMIMGILYSLQTLGWIDTSSTLFQLLNVFSNAAFYYLPMYLAFSSGRRFGCNPYVAAVLAGILIHPTFIEMISAGNSVMEMGFIKITLQNYSSTVVPVILSVLFLSYVEKGLKRVVPKMIDIIVTPTLSLLIAGTIALWILGPLGQEVGRFVAEGFAWIYNQFGMLGGLLYALCYPFILATGMQVAFIPLIVMNLDNLGYDFIYPFIAASNAAMAAAALYIFVKSKKTETKSLAGSTGISALIGITEPVLYGVVMKFKKALLPVMIGGAAGGAIMGLFKVQYAGFGFVPFGTIILAFGPTFTFYLIGVFVAMLVTVVMLRLSKFDADADDSHLESLTQPVKGRVIPISEINDPTFSQGYLGKGVGIVPEDNKVYAPVDSKIVSLFHTGHAIGLETETGVEILIHIGIDTVKMDGEGFSTSLKQGDTVKEGQLLIEFDRKLIIERGYDTTVCVVVVNSSDYEVQTHTEGKTIIDISMEAEK